jgi:hypothetical protein
MLPRKSLVLFFTALYIILYIIMMSVPAHADGAVYSWQDADGVTTFTDDPSLAPSDAKVKVFQSSMRSTASAETPAPSTPSQPSQIATEGEFAVQLVEELGLSEDPTAGEAADILTEIRIVPRLGQWELDQPMTEELTSRLRMLAVAAAESGRLLLSSEEVLLAFDTTAALLGLTIPVTPLEEASETVSEAPYPLAEAPPLVYVTTPPPAVYYPYYTWFPVTGGFWWNGVFCPGFFVLNTDFYFAKHHGRSFKGHRNWDSDHIGRRFQNRLAGRQSGRESGFLNNGRVPRSPTDARRSSVSNRFPARSRDGMGFSARSRTSPQSRHFSQRSSAGSMRGSITGQRSRSVSRPLAGSRPVYGTRSISRPMTGSMTGSVTGSMTRLGSGSTIRSGIRNIPVNGTVRRQPSSYRMSMGRGSRQSFSGGYFNRTAPSRSFSGPSRQTFSGGYRSAPSRSFSGRSGGFSAPSGQGFRMGNAGMNRGGSGFAARGSFRGR